MTQKKSNLQEHQAPQIETQPKAKSVATIPKLLSILSDVRADLSTAMLSKTFNPSGSGEYEAFSIHALASEVEKSIVKHGIAAEFQVTKWAKSGNSATVEGRLDLILIATGETRSYACVGEGVDNYDKALGKALSSARKAGFIQAFNLAIGKDIEASNEGVKPEAPVAGVTAAATLRLILPNLDTVMVEPFDLLHTFVAAIKQCSSTTQLDAFLRENSDIANRLHAGSDADRATLATLEVAIEDHREDLTERAKHAEAA